MRFFRPPPAKGVTISVKVAVNPAVVENIKSGTVPSHYVPQPTPGVLEGLSEREETGAAARMFCNRVR